MFVMVVDYPLNVQYTLIVDTETTLLPVAILFRKRFDLINEIK